MTSDSQALILFLASNPQGTSAIKLDEEAREIPLALREAEFRDRIRFETCWAVRPKDVRRALNRLQPDIVHLSCHGTRRAELVLTSDAGTRQPVSQKALVALFATMGAKIQAVVLNSCFSTNQASQIAEKVGLAIGMSSAIGIDAAIVFSEAFYSALGYGHSYQAALEQAKVALLLNGLAEENVPTIHARSDCDPEEMFLLGPSNSTEKSVVLRVAVAGLAAVGIAAVTVGRQATAPVWPAGPGKGDFANTALPQVSLRQPLLVVETGPGSETPAVENPVASIRILSAALLDDGRLEVRGELLLVGNSPDALRRLDTLEVRVTLVDQGTVQTDSALIDRRRKTWKVYSVPDRQFGPGEAVSFEAVLFRDRQELHRLQGTILVRGEGELP